MELKDKESSCMEMCEEGKEETLPPGYRFHPSDEELITYYLINKISDSNFTGRAIGDVDLNKCEPWDLPGTYLACLSSLLIKFQYHIFSLLLITLYIHT